MRFLRTLTERAESAVDLTPVRYVIVKKVHPTLKSNGGYYAIHDRKVWHWVKDLDNATTFSSPDAALLAAVGSMVDIYHYYEIERI